MNLSIQWREWDGVIHLFNGEDRFAVYQMLCTGQAIRNPFLIGSNRFAPDRLWYGQRAVCPECQAIWAAHRLEVSVNGS